MSAKAAGATTDLFGWLDSLFNKSKPEGAPPTFMMHRFLVSDRDFAPAARVLQVNIRDPYLVWGTWQAMLPKGRGAPRLQYAAAKKPPAEEALVARMRQVLPESRHSIETMIAIVKAAGREAELYTEFGVTAPC